MMMSGGKTCAYCGTGLGDDRGVTAFRIVTHGRVQYAAVAGTVHEDPCAEFWMLRPRSGGVMHPVQTTSR